jgi:hypothetical protein
MRTPAHAMLASLALMSIACGGSPVSPERTSTPPSSAAMPFLSEHFAFHYTPLDANNISSIADSVEREYGRITRDLGVDAMPRVNVRFYADHAALASALAPIIGPIPSWATGAATRSDEMHLVSPNHPAFGPYDRMISNTIHEFAHCVSLRINASIANNPRWFWESVAIYESGQAVDPRSLPYMTGGRPPSLSTLDSFDNTMVYEVGYTIAEFIVARGGHALLAQMIANNANLESSMGLTRATFEREWFAFVRQRYGL